jgi:hypothetical protein
MDQTANLDLSQLSFSQFVQFFFDHPEDEQFWYADPQYALKDLSFPGQLLVDHLTKLFFDFGAVVGKYSAVQISHGIWAMFSPSFSLFEVLWDPSVPVQRRAECIRSMGRLFTDYVCDHDAEPLQKCFYMWWHIVVTGFWAQAGQFESQDVSNLDPDSATLLETMFQTLTQILSSNDPRTQGYALHGLGHLQHPRVHEVVQRYLDENKDRFTDDHVRWIEQCRDGVVS